MSKVFWLSLVVAVGLALGIAYAFIPDSERDQMVRLHKAGKLTDCEASGILAKYDAGYPLTAQLIARTKAECLLHGN